MGYWEDQPGSNAMGTWQLYEDPSKILNGSWFDSARAAALAGRTECKTKLKEFLKAHFKP